MRPEEGQRNEGMAVYSSFPSSYLALSAGRGRRQAWGPQRQTPKDTSVISGNRLSSQLALRKLSSISFYPCLPHFSSLYYPKHLLFLSSSRNLIQLQMSSLTPHGSTDHQPSGSLNYVCRIFAVRDEIRSRKPEVNSQTPGEVSCSIS